MTFENQAPCWVPALALAAALPIFVLACGGNVQTSAGGAAGSTSAGGTGGSVPAGDCQSAADCAGAPCEEVTPGGFKVCLSNNPPEATMCNPDSVPPDECCNSSECAEGKCYHSTNVPSCGVVHPDENLCFPDQCQSDGECATADPSACVPAGAYGPMKRCVTAYCKTNEDCTAKPGGYCAPIENPCCPTPLALACVYPGGCRKQADCSSDFSKSCEIDEATKEAVCVDGGVGCPE